MSDKKISQLTALTGANTASNDVLPIVDTSATETKKITLTELQSAPISAGTSNGVAYLNGSKVLTTGSALTFDGSKLGIGTASPAAELVVSQPAANSSLRVLRTAANPDYYAGVRTSGDQVYFTGSQSSGLQIECDPTNFTAGSAIGMTVDGSQAFTLSTTNLISYINNSEQMRLTSTGLGIGTSSPSYGLDVNKQYAIIGASGGEGAYLTRNSSGTLQWKVGQSGSALQFLDFIAGSERMRIDSSGNVGIGTSSPGGKVDAVTNATGAFVARASTNGTGQTVNAMTAVDLGYANYANAVFRANQYQFNIASTEAMRLDSSGNVGIGTSSPTRPLTIKAGNPCVILQTTTTGGTSTDGLSIEVDSSSNGYLWNYEAAPLIFGTNSIERMRIDSSGNIYGTAGTTGMTNGFFYIPSAGGAPSGTPTAVTGRVPMYYDTTNNQFYVYNGAWKKVTLA